MKFLLSFKDWQLFLLIAITLAWISPSPLQEIMKAIGGLTFLGWLYAIILFGQKELTRIGIKKVNLTLFKINLAFLVLSIAFLILRSLDMFQFRMPEGLSLFFAFYFMFTFFHQIAVAAIIIATLDLQRKSKFMDWIGYFLGIVALPFGIWIIQPKVNEMLGKRN